MSFFSKLRERLTKSSSKIGTGLDDLIGQGTDAAAAAPRPAPEPAPTSQPTPAPQPPAPAPAPQSPTPAPQPAPQTPPAPRPAAPQPASQPGLMGRLFGGGAPAEPRRELDDAMLEDLEDMLIAADMGTETALRVTANIAEGRMGRKISATELKQALADEVTRIMTPVARPLPLYAKKPQVVLVVGVNGSGKTTTIGKLASQFKAAGKSVVIAAGDTFRAAAVEQLQVWGQRAGVPVMVAAQGSDPASLAYDAMARAEAEGADLLLIDTAGRLQNRADLMEELAKIVRVIRKRDPSAPHNTLLVLDATTGQNALSQVETFRKLADVSGLVMTKLDGTARGGVLVALADRFGLPIHAIGVGEQIDDLDAFEPDEFARALVGL
ncbi:signal recognition particle-docking protein FtsY [Paracoccus sanguinis]|uniref:signal recognition particle-docking protein FtsY n=1 Tax=Paracoccus sanguinis TaxID=1545044 RepID=UPI001451339E|nr:signal recognition particle-docking protein FtsY [Paracoccus sanguinis]QJD17930.1 signal recognition particle-docking protein FtsY [Paracoccus sanguinis]